MKIPRAWILAAAAFVPAVCPAEAKEGERTDASTASARLCTEDSSVSVKVDLHDGWSVKFEKDAVLFYEEGQSPDGDAAAEGLLLGRKAYEEELSGAKADEGRSEEETGIFYTQDDGTQAFLSTGGDDLPFRITAADADIREVLGRLSLKAEADDPDEKEAKEALSAAWPCDAFYEDQDGNFLSVTWMEMEDEKGWYVGCMIGEESLGGLLLEEGGRLAGTLTDSEGQSHSAGVSPSGDGAELLLDGIETWVFSPVEYREAKITVQLDTEGIGKIAYAPAKEELAGESYYDSACFGLDSPASYVFAAKSEVPGWSFTKWMKDGELFSAEPVLTVDLTESAAFVAVFDYSEEE